MKRTNLFTSMAVVLTAAAAAVVSAQTPAQTQTQVQTRTEAQERVIYGSHLMTPQERNEYQNRMRELKTQEERAQFRKEHHAKMQERAKERGMTLPAEPPAQGRGMGPRSGDRPGMGAGPSPAPGGGGKGR